MQVKHELNMFVSKLLKAHEPQWQLSMYSLRIELEQNSFPEEFWWFVLFKPCVRTSGGGSLGLSDTVGRKIMTGEIRDSFFFSLKHYKYVQK